MLISEFANTPPKKKKNKKTKEGIGGTLAGTLGGMALGDLASNALGMPDIKPYTMTAGSMLGGLAGSSIEDELTKPKRAQE